MRVVGRGDWRPREGGPERTSTMKKRFIDRLLLAVTGLGLTCFAVAGWWLRASEADPEVNVPTPSAPVPNAYDFYERAALMVAPPREAKPIDAVYDKQRRERDLPLSKRHYPLGPRLRHLRRNADALAELRRGLAYPSLHPAVRSLHDRLNGGAGVRHYKLYQLASVLRVECHLRADRGDWAGAAKSALDVLQLGTDIPRGGAHMAGFTGCGIQSLGQGELWRILPHLDRAANATVASRLQRIVNRRTPYTQTLEEEKYVTQAGMVEIFHQLDWRTEMAAAIRPYIDYNQLTSAENWRFRTIFRRTLMRNVSTAFDALIVNARQPYGRPLPPVDIDDPFSQAVVPLMYSTRFYAERSRVVSDLMLTAVALRRYRFDHGSFPAALQSLTPGYLRALPCDGFNAEAPFHYRRQGASYVLWSVGPDLHNDNGMPIVLNRKRGWNRRSIFPDSRGDIIAGIHH